MTNFKHYLFAVVALVAGFAISACTNDPANQGGGNSAKTSIEVLVGEPTPASVEITVKTTGIKEFAYIVDKDVEASAILAGGIKTTIEATDDNGTTWTAVSDVEKTFNNVLGAGNALGLCQ